MGRILVGLLAALLLTAQAAAAPVADVRFRLIDNRVFVPAYLNGRGPFHLLLDTGADTGGISLGTMRAIGARAEGAERVGGAGEGTDRVLRTRIATLAIGGALWRNQPVIAQSFSALNDVIGFQ